MGYKKKITLGILAIIGLIVIASIIILQKPQPTHNPFDAVFNVSISTLEEQSYIREDIECGYANYIKSRPNGRVYYQVFIDQPDIVAKGCDIILDTLCKECAENTKELSDTIIAQPGLQGITEGQYRWMTFYDSLSSNSDIQFNPLYRVDTSLIAERLKPFQVNLIDTSFKQQDFGYSFKVRHTPTDNIFTCLIEMSWDSKRTISVFTGNPQPFSEKPVIKFFTSLFKKEQFEMEEVPTIDYSEE